MRLSHSDGIYVSIYCQHFSSNAAININETTYLESLAKIRISSIVLWRFPGLDIISD